MAVDTLVPRTRRSVLVGAIGGVAATIASALGRPAATEAAAGSTRIIGSEANNAGSANTQLLTNSSVVAFKLLQNGPGTALMGYTTPATGATRGVYGRVDSPNGDGVQGRNQGASGTGAAIRGYGVNNHGVVGLTDYDEAYGVKGVGFGVGVYGESTGNRAGVKGFSPEGVGVEGVSTDMTGVSGVSTQGYGVMGQSTNGYAGYFANQVLLAGWLDVLVGSVPGDPPPDSARLYVHQLEDKTTLSVRFDSGTVVQLAQEA